MPKLKDKKSIFIYIKNNCNELFGPSFIATQKNLKFDYNIFNDQKIKKIISKFGNYRKIKILYLSSYKPNYTRTETLLDLFERNKINYKSIITGKQRFKYIKLVWNLILNQNRYDIILVAFRGHEILPFIKLFARKPIIYDAFTSIYDTLCFDRQIINPKSIIGKLLKWYDIFLCRISNYVLLDTKTHRQYFIDEFNVPENKIGYLYVGCNEKLFKPIKTKKDPNKFIIFWYGNSFPLQGVDNILKVAKKIEKYPNILFRLVGPVRQKHQKLVAKLKFKNVQFIDWVPYEKLPLEIAKADLCLGGHFSKIPKAQRVIPGKMFQFLACGQPTLVAINKANNEIINSKLSE
jgi:glycosyltransferase involved in cell wall biosynthesis